MRYLLVASALLHAAVFAVLLRRPTTIELPTPPPVEVAIDLESEPSSPREPEPEPEPVPVPGPRDPRVAMATTRGSEAPASAAPPASSAISEPAAGNTSWVVNLGSGAEAKGGVGGIGSIGIGTNPFLVNPPAGSSGGRVAEEPPNPNAKRKDNSLAAELRAQDAMKGLNPAAGVVIHSLEDETRTSLAPLRGNATFRAIVDATGAVTGLNLLDATGDRAGWNDARERALVALQKKKLDMRGTNGALIDIRIESEMRLPSGATGRLSANGSGMAGDLADIGSSATRVVHARISNFTPL